MTIAETARLHIRWINETDAPFVLQLLNTPGWIQFIGERGVHTTEDARRYIAERFTASYAKFGWGMYLVLLKESGLPIGMCGLVKRDNLEHADLGYAFLPEYGGKGYALEAATAVMQFATETLQLRPILAIVTPGNQRSIVLLQKLDFAFQKKITDNGEELLLFKSNTDVPVTEQT
jgi:RimJ/RimL family protein N-acetyltransferase